MQLSKFKPEILEYKRAPVIVILAKRGCGKSTLIKDIVSHLNVNTPIVMSGIESATGFYSEHIPTANVYDEFRPDIITNIISEQTQRATEMKIQYPDREFTDFPEQGILIIMDDLPYDAKMMKEPCMKLLFFNGRHLNITLVMSFQYLVAIPPPFRTNIDYIFVGHDITKEYIDKLYRTFFDIFEKIGDFRAAFRAATQNYGYLVLDKTSLSVNLSDNVFWYRATL